MKEEINVLSFRMFPLNFNLALKLLNSILYKFRKKGGFLPVWGLSFFWNVNSPKLFRIQCEANIWSVRGFLWKGNTKEAVLYCVLKYLKSQVNLILKAYFWFRNNYSLYSGIWFWLFKLYWFTNLPRKTSLSK